MTISYRQTFCLPMFAISMALPLACASGKTPSTAVTKTANALDGSSFEKAVNVKSIDEEYNLIAEHYPGSKFLGQALVFNAKKPFDRLSIELPDGSKKDVYFDISSFFGKF